MTPAFSALFGSTIVTASYVPDLNNVMHAYFVFGVSDEFLGGFSENVK